MLSDILALFFPNSSEFREAHRKELKALMPHMACCAAYAIIAIGAVFACMAGNAPDWAILIAFLSFFAAVIGIVILHVVALIRAAKKSK